MDTSKLSSVSGQVLEPGDGAFDEARALWNTRFDRRPDLVVRCKSSSDVKASIDYARENELQLSVNASGALRQPKSIRS